MPAREHHYALDAAFLLDSCRRRLRVVLKQDGNRHGNLADLDQTLHATERLIHFHLLAIVDKYEKEEGISGPMIGEGAETLMGTVARLQTLTKKGRQQPNQKRSVPLRKSQINNRAGAGKKGRHGRYGRQHHTSDRFQQGVNSHFPRDLTPRIPGQPRGVAPQSPLPAVPETRFGAKTAGAWNEQHAGDTSSSYTVSVGPRGSFIQARSPEDSLLFSLIVLLQLCQVRIEEADKIVCGWECAKQRSEAALSAGGLRRRESDSGNQSRSCASPEPIISDHSKVEDTESLTNHSGSGRTMKIIGVGLFGVGASLLFRKLKDPADQRRILLTTGKVASGVLAASLVRRGWMVLGMNARLTHSTTALEDWQHQWVLLQSIGTGDGKEENGDSNRLLELIESQCSTSLVWHSYSALRFLFIKRTMDVLYASVGAAMQMTKSKTKKPPKFLMPIATAVAASYYSLTGPSTKSAEVVSSSSQDFVKNAWGVVSLPAVKNLSLQASRILKGAAIAERMTIAGVPCVILSSGPRPALATALKRFRRQQERETLGTILETSLTDEDAAFRRHYAARTQDYPAQDIIFHLTGGGFFAHTLAGDLPFLLDWSRITDSVIICPEYALLPEHRFPVAADQVTNIYCSIVSGDAAPLLGFRADRIIVTGEAAGGNLATALCVKLCMDQFVDIEASAMQRKNAKDGEAAVGNILPAGEMQFEHKSDTHQSGVRLPDALMLSCPALNMSLELTPSRVRGTNDPVLPSGLIKTISEGYLPPGSGVDNTDPVASPYYAPDEILSLFPHTLLCESSNDPLLDDSVDFNTRLRRLGVESDLRAVNNMPHAFWGLSSAGFPEAKQVQVECQSWLMQQFCRGREDS